MSERAADADKPVEPGGADTRRPLLVVEDEPAIVRTIERLLRRTWPIRVAGTLADARRLLGGPEQIGGAVLDVGLPDGSGLDLLEEIRLTRPTLRVLVLTVHHAPEVVNRAQLLGAEYAVKPRYTDGLMAFVERLAAATVVDLERAEREVDACVERYGLSPRERDVICLALSERSRDEVASSLGLSVNTVKAHIASLLGKTGETSLYDLVRKLREGMRI